MAYSFNGSSQKLTFTVSGLTSVSAFSCAFWINHTSLAAYKQHLCSRSSGVVGTIITGATGSNKFGGIWEGTADEYDRATGLTLVTGEWLLAGMSVATGSPGSLISYLYRPSTDTFSTDTNSKTLTAKSPSAFAIGTDGTVGGNYIAGSMAEVVMAAATWPADVFRALGRGYTPGVVIRRGAFYAPLIRELTDLWGAVSITNTGSTPVVAHPPVIMPRRRPIGFAGTSPPPPPPSTYQGARFQMPGVSIFSGRAA